MPSLSDEENRIFAAFSQLDSIAFAIVRGFAIEGTKIWITGGAVRDVIAGRKVTDLDLVCDKDPIPFLRSFAKSNGFGFAVLDATRKIARLVTSSKALATIDVAMMQGNTIEDDLNCRDFTVNAIAVKWSGGSVKIIDPLDGISDLHNKVLRPASATAFKNDPVRIIRGYRFELEYALTQVPQIAQMAIKFKNLLAKAPGERVTQEITHILKNRDSHKAFSAMDKDGVLEILFPEVTASKAVTQNKWHHLDVYDHTMETLKRFEKTIKNTPGWLAPWKAKIDRAKNIKITGGLDALSVTKLAVIYHDTGKPVTRAVADTGKVTFYGHEKESGKLANAMAKRLKLSKTAHNALLLLVENHLRPLNAITDGNISRRSVYRYTRDMGEWCILALLISVADALATNGPAVTQARRNNEHNAILKVFDHLNELEKTPIEPVVTGKDILTSLGVKPGPMVGKLLKDAHEALALNQIKTRKDALIFLEKRLKEYRH